MRGLVKWVPWLVAASACAVVPVHTGVDAAWFSRRNTTNLSGVFFPANVVRVSYTVFQAALPNEGVVCYYGVAKDSVLVGHPAPYRYLQVLDAIPGEVTAATPFGIAFPPDVDGIPDACPAKTGLLGIGHDHLFNIKCQHSDSDAMYLFARRELYFSFVVCAGSAEVLWQDGRRQEAA